MRLTLRTLLAYMDEILEPKDAEDIGKKIEASETATDLLHRIRDVMGRLRLKAPDVADPGVGLDPNTVAEYLDNTLPDDRVPDFEKVCLESDMHLAEVASCHQVLALVLGEPAEVDPASREHMYQLPQVLAEQAAMEAQAAGEQREEEPAKKRRRSKPVVPDYLRESRAKRRLWPAAAVVVLLVVVAGAVVLGINGQLAFLGIGPEVLDRPVAQEPAKAPAPGEVEATVPGEGVPGEEQTAPAEQPPDVEAPPDVTPPDATPTDATPTEPIIPQTKVPAEKPLPGPPQPPAEGTQPKLPAEGPLPEEPVKLPPPPGEGPDEAVEPPDEPPPAAPPAPIPVERMGRFISDGQILLQLDPQSGSWRRVPAQGILTPQYELLALPTFRPLIAMAAGVTVHLVSPAQVKLQPTDAEGIQGLSVAYGRLVVRTVGKAETQLRLNVGKRTGLITFQDAESTVAVEVTRQLVAGADPETQLGAVTFDLIAVSGRIAWQEGPDSPPIELDAPRRQRLTPLSEPQASPKPELPKWITSDATGLLDRRASDTLARAIETDRPVGLVLRELTEHRQREVRRLAMRCLGYIGEFDLMVGALDNPNKRLIWQDCAEYLQAAVARGPAQATRVRKAFEKDYGEQSAKLVRLLWGFTQDQLKNGQDAMLVEYLDDQRLIFRVLGFWNLKRITHAGLYYQAEATAAKRQQSVRKWRQRQEAGEIRFKSPPKKAAP